MKYIKRFGYALIILSCFVLFVYIFNGDSLQQFLESDRGPLVALMAYFKNADFWSAIFFTITFGFGFGFFMALIYVIKKLFSWLAIKYHKLSFLDSYFFKLTSIGLAFLLLLIFFILGSNIYVSYNGAKMATQKLSDIPENSSVFILGTAKYLKSGNINLYYKYRMDAARELWKAGKVKEFILSGDGVGEAHSEDYDETKDMKEDLLADSIPLEKIKIDPYGFNTQQSILRLRGVFKLKNIVIISQDFHTRRAVVLCDYYGINSKSYDARGSASFAMTRKEVLISRPRLVVDILFANMQPQVNNDGDFKVREEFDATQSNKHASIVLTVVAIVAAVFISIGVYLMKRDKKVVIRAIVITSSLSVILLILSIQTYKHYDIQFVNDIVESTATTLGIGSSLVEEKIEKKKEIFESEKRTSQNVTPKKVVIKLDSATIAKQKEDSLANVKAVAVAEKKKNLFNTQEDRALLKQLETQRMAEKAKRTADSILLAEQTAKDMKAKKKKALFNSSMADGEVSSNKIFFSAKVLGSQKFADNQEVSFRTSEPVDLNGITLPENFVFTAKANVFDNKIHFVVRTLNSVPVSCENYTNSTRGMALKDEFKYNESSYLLSDGMMVTFGASVN